MHQLKFECTTDDERSETEVMPWARHIGNDDPSTRAVTKLDSPKWIWDGENKKPTGPTKLTSTSTDTTKSAKPNLPLLGIHRLYQKQKTDLTEE